MEEYTELEKRFIEHLKKQQISWMSDNTHEKIYNAVVMKSFGPGARDPRISINWGKVFDENLCPACNGTITLKENEYLCKKCGFTIPLDLYDKAASEYHNRKKLFDEDKKIMDEVRKAGIKPNVLKNIYGIAKQQAREEIEKMKAAKNEVDSGKTS